jgi:hypothetical protein
MLENFLGLLFDSEAGGDTVLQIVLLSPTHTGTTTENQFDFCG